MSLYPAAWAMCNALRMAQVMTCGEAARAAEVSDDTIRRAFDAGELAGMRTASGLRLIDRAALEAYARARAEKRAAERRAATIARRLGR
jgi:excisionase family DNA binding protein